MNYKNYIPHLSAIVLFLLISFIYFIKPLSEGKKLNMSDVTHHKGASQEINKYYQEEGKKTYWTNSMFSGMPTYLIQTPAAPKSLRVIHRTLNLNQLRPVSFVFLYLLGFYIGLLCFKVNPWVSIVGAIAYAFSSYFFIIIEVGHATKIGALGYLPAILGGFHLAFNGKRILGALIMTVFLALQLLVNHPQMTYYTLIIVLIYGIVLFVKAITDRQFKNFVLTSIVLASGALIALGCNMGVLMPIMEYSDHSIRGGSELVVDEKNQTSGLDLDYATQWSYGLAESFTILIPNFMGGASGGELPVNSETYKLYEKHQGKATAKKAIKRQPTYWGKVIFTSGPVYVGAIICLLFVFALFITDKKYVWWLVAATCVSFIFAWGKHIPNVTRLLFEYIPMYNKFRAVSSALVMVQFTMPLLAFLAIDKVLKNEVPKEKALKALKYAVAITSGLLLFFILFAGGLFNFESLNDEQYIAQGNSVLVDALQADRLMLLKRDAGRSLVFVLLGAGLLFVYLKDKIKLSYFILALAFLILVDMWGVNRRYLNNDDFVSKRKVAQPYTASAADEAILKDPDPNYRVLNLAVSTFNDASTSNFHKSIGGYHGAKMRRYQELITFHISEEMQRIFTSFKSQDFDVINNALKSSKVLNMLNTKYIIYNPAANPIVNNTANGHAWFVNDIKWADNANEEIEMLDKINLQEEVVIDKRFKGDVGSIKPGNDSTAFIKLISHAPNIITYQSNSKTEQLAVFSEIYYPESWVVKIDGELVKAIRANYVLRALKIPAGEHSIEFEFIPVVYNKGRGIAQASTIILFVTFLGLIGFHFYDDRKKNAQKNEPIAIK